MSSVHFGHGTTGRVGSEFRSQAIRRKCSQNPTRRYDNKTLRHPFPGYRMWRGNHSKYLYQSYQSAKYGEGEAQKEYHQYFAHSKDPYDSNKANEHEHLIIHRGIPHVLPLPKPQIPPGSVPKWHWKSWQMPYTSVDIWRRELEYSEHIPTHQGKQYTRPLSILAPKIKYRQIQGRYMKEIRIIICPFVFGYGKTLQNLVMDFYKICTSCKNLIEKKQLQLTYSLEQTLPIVEITWLDGAVYRPPIFEGMSAYDILQSCMEESWRMEDKIHAQCIKLPEGDYPDLGLWESVLEYKLSKRAKLEMSQEETEKADASKQKSTRG